MPTPVLRELDASEVRDVLTPYRRAIKRLLIIEQDQSAALDFAACMAVAVHLGRGQVGLWGYLCGPASRGKSEILLSLKNVPRLLYLDDATPAGLFSGYDPDGVRSKARANGESDEHDTSLMKELDGKVLVIHDLSAALSTPQKADALYSFFRAAYDGSFAKQFGTVGRHEIKARFGMLCGIVPASLDMVLRHAQRAGERFVVCRIGTIRRREEDALYMGRRLYKDSKREGGRAEIRKGLRGATRDLLMHGARQVQLGRTMVDRHYLDAVSAIAYYLVQLRSQHNEGAPADPEGEQRVTQVLQDLCHVRARLYGRDHWNPEEVAFAARIARDTIPQACMHLLLALAYFPPTLGRGRTAHQIVDALPHLGFDYVSGQLVQWRTAGLIGRRDGQWFVKRAVRERLTALGLLVPPHSPDN